MTFESFVFCFMDPLPGGRRRIPGSLAVGAWPTTTIPKDVLTDILVGPSPADNAEPKELSSD